MMLNAPQICVSGHSPATSLPSGCYPVAQLVLKIFRRAAAWCRGRGADCLVFAADDMIRARVSARISIRPRVEARLGVGDLGSAGEATSGDPLEHGGW